MGYIKDPENVDFIINSEPLTEQERVMISELIMSYKESRKKTVKEKNIENQLLLNNNTIPTVPLRL